MTNDEQTIEYFEISDPEFRERMGEVCAHVMRELQKKCLTPGEAYYALKVCTRYMEDRFNIEIGPLIKSQTDLKQ